MATPKKRGDKWLVQFRASGRRFIKSFPTRAEAVRWEAQTRIVAAAEATGRAGSIHTLGDAIDKYLKEVAPSHKGERWERIRLAALAAQLPVTITMDRLTTARLNEWKQERLRVVSAATVNREMNLLSSVFGYARRDWGWISVSPLANVRRPPAARHRERTITASEIRRLLRAMGYRAGMRPASKTECAAYALLLALHTGMRASELCGMRWERMRETWVRLPETKNGTERDVPLDRGARRLIAALRGADAGRVLPITAATLDVLFRRTRDALGIADLHFHDARHSAATRIGRVVGQPGRLSFPEFVRVFGWRDPKFAMVYVNPSAEELARKL